MRIWTLVLAGTLFTSIAGAAMLPPHEYDGPPDREVIATRALEVVPQVCRRFARILDRISDIKIKWLHGSANPLSRDRIELTATLAPSVESDFLIGKEGGVIRMHLLGGNRPGIFLRTRASWFVCDQTTPVDDISTFLDVPALGGF